MKIESTRFGTLEVTSEQIIHFPHGIPGFLVEKAFVHLPHDEDSPFSFLQSTAEADLSFLLVDPFPFIPKYEFVLDDELVRELELSEENPPQIFLIGTVKEKITDMTVNLLAPIVVNRGKGIGRQIILDKTEYSIRHKLFPEDQAQGTPEGGE
ncbi:flagellar assembly protein FliW [Desulfitobacterium chlororespirans]|uniref:Flagellar assembly factor FliW n=1 Tax=Desulfitobacterium chlororespirans DSM 11544 TaxID=1121395 RepID=A0A1M7UDC2_9FIRM|nr:flagellar assembly protein FliW [Desulfitobacterium chlororespirans]SHN80925.1 flagellar assembly factor FliW [Desulfitobacterium chlororespirans DSM 11544]